MSVKLAISRIWIIYAAKLDQSTTSPLHVTWKVRVPNTHTSTLHLYVDHIFSIYSARPLCIRTLLEINWKCVVVGHRRLDPICQPLRWTHCLQRTPIWHTHIPLLTVLASLGVRGSGYWVRIEYLCWGGTQGDCRLGSILRCGVRSRTQQLHCEIAIDVNNLTPDPVLQNRACIWLCAAENTRTYS